MTAAKATPSRLTNFPGLDEYEAPDKMHEGRLGVAEFNGRPVRWIWHNGERHFSVADAVGSITESANPGTYWRVLKKRLLEEGADQTVSSCNGFKLPASDGKMRKADCVSTKVMLRIVQSVPHANAEPFKLWLAQLGHDRLEEIAQPSKGVDRAIDTYRRQGREDPWIDSRLQAVAARNQLTDEWKERGVAGKEMAGLTARMGKEMVGVTPKEHRELKGISDKMDVRDQMDRLELAFVTLGEQAATSLIQERNTQGSSPTKEASMDGAQIAGDARRALEEKLGRPVANSSNFLPNPTAAPALPDPDSEAGAPGRKRAR